MDSCPGAWAPNSPAFSAMSSSCPLLPDTCQVLCFLTLHGIDILSPHPLLPGSTANPDFTQTAATFLKAILCQQTRPLPQLCCVPGWREIQIPANCARPPAAHMGPVWVRAPGRAGAQEISGGPAWHGSMPLGRGTSQKPDGAHPSLEKDHAQMYPGPPGTWSRLKH